MNAAVVPRSKRRAAFAGAVALVALLLAQSASPAPLPSGMDSLSVDVGGVPIFMLTYKPAAYAGGPLLVSFHGLGRNVLGTLEATKPIADRRNMLVVVPLFDRARFPYWRYQALGITKTSRRVTNGAIRVEPPSTWTIQLITGVIDKVRALEGRPDLDYYLIGHSAGGQVADRFAAFGPGGAKRIIVANPSSYVEPSLATRFPYGFADLPASLADEAAIRRYLAKPVTILVGTEDVLQKALDMHAAAIRQGLTRRDRGRNVFERARALALARGWTFNWRLLEVPLAGHSARRMYAGPEALDALDPPY